MEIYLLFLWKIKNGDQHVNKAFSNVCCWNFFLFWHAEWYSRKWQVHYQTPCVVYRVTTTISDCLYLNLGVQQTKPPHYSHTQNSTHFSCLNDIQQNSSRSDYIIIKNGQWKVTCFPLVNHNPAKLVFKIQQRQQFKMPLFTSLSCCFQLSTSC